MVWDRSRKAPAVVTRDDAGVDVQGVDAQLRYRGKVKLKDGRQIEVRTSFDLLAQYLDENMTPVLVEKITGAPAKAVVALAEEIARNPEKTLFPGIRPANPGLIGHAPLSLRRGRPAAVSRRRAAG